jgi:hypothetical protein
METTLQRRYALPISRFAALTEEVIETCLQARGFRVAGLEPGFVAHVVEQAGEATRVLGRPSSEILTQELVGLGDWTLALLADLYAAVQTRYRVDGYELRSSVSTELHARLDGHRSDAPFGRIESLVDSEFGAMADKVERKAFEALARVVDSPTASPMLWYQGVFNELSDHHAKDDIGRAIELKLRCLAHDLYLHDGPNACGLLRDLAGLWIRAGDGARGLRVLVGLLDDDPADIWNYNWVATSGDLVGADLARYAAERGLQLIEARGDAKQLSQQLRAHLDDQRNDPCAWPEAAAALRTALGRGFDGSALLPAELCHTLVPELRQVQLKQGLAPLELQKKTRRNRRKRRRRA